MKKTRRISRRTLLRGALAGSVVTVGLPWLEVFHNDGGRALAAESNIPPRFGIFFWGNGVIPEFWNPIGEGEGDDWELSELLLPLAEHKENISVVSGMEVKTANKIPHHSGAAGLLSGAALLEDGRTETFAGPSIDQLVAAEIGGDTRFRSLEFGAEVREGYSYIGPNNFNPFENSPFGLFERVFGAGFRLPGETTMVDPKIALRRSVLDVLGEDVKDLNKSLGTTDRTRLEQHLDGIRALEMRLARLEEEPPNRDACAMPSAPLPEYPAIEGRPQVREKNRAMCDIVAMALACDQTRVFFNQITQPVTNILFEGASAGHHQLTHDEPGDQPQVRSIVTILMEEFAYFVSALKAVPEGDLTLLDNTVLLATTDVSLGRTHSLTDFPLLIAGSAGGRLRQNIHYRSKTKENTSKFMLTLARAVGARSAAFGTERGESKETLGALET